jgi:protease I
MLRKKLEGVRIAILAADGFEQVELTRPRATLRRNGADVDVVSIRPGSIRGMNLLFPGKKVKVDRTIFTADADDYDGLMIPGGFVNPDFLRQSERVLDFVRDFDIMGKPIASMCHGPWVLISAGVAAGRRLTSWPGIRDDVENAGGVWIDKSVVVDGNLLTSRGPHDLLRFGKAIVRHFSPTAEAREYRYPLPFGKAVAGGLALAALGYGLRRREQDHRHVH